MLSNRLPKNIICHSAPVPNPSNRPSCLSLQIYTPSGYIVIQIASLFAFSILLWPQMTKIGLVFIRLWQTVIATDCTCNRMIVAFT